MPTDDGHNASAKERDANTLADDSKTIADSPAAGAEHRSPVQVPDHELLTCIGRGSYGEVWLARNVMGTYRAVKIVYRAAFEHARPFEREFNGIQKFEPISRSHDGFVDVLQIGRTQDYFYYVMELADDVVTGQQIDPATYEPKTLRSQVQAHKPLPFEQCVELGLSLTAALSHLHGHGLIHRDIKPSNIIFVNGIAKLADIGLVAEQSEAKSFVGTEGFIPPEGPGTPQADIYSLGKVLYEIATGKDRHEFPALPTLLGDSGTDTHLLELNSVFLKACQTELKSRYGDAAEMRNDLLLLQSGRSVKRSQLIERRLQRIVRSSIAGTALLILVLAILFYAKVREQQAAAQAQREAALRQRAEAGELTARQNQYAAEMNLAQQALRAQDFGRAMDLVNRQIPKPLELDLRGFEWRYLRQLTLGDEVETLRGHSDIVWAVAFSPSGKYLASAGFDSLVRVWDLERRTIRWNLPGGVTDLSYSRDGAILASSSSTNIVFWDMNSGREIRSLPQAQWSVAFSPDGKSFAAQQQDGVGLWDFATLSQVHRMPKVRGPVVFSPDGTVLATFNASGAVLWNTATGLELTRIEDVQPSIRQFAAFSTDGKLLALSSAECDVRLWDWQSRRMVSAIREHGSMVFKVSFSPDGQSFASCSGDQTIRIWSTKTWERIALLKGHANEVWAVQYSPDGKTLASGGKDFLVKLWDISPKDRLPERLEGAVPLWYSPNGRTLATWTQDGHLVFRDTASLQEQSSRDFARGRSVLSARLSPDGALLAVMNQDSRVNIFNVDSGSLRCTVRGEPGRFYFDLAFAADGRSVATSTPESSVQLWDSSTGSLKFTLSDSTWPMVFSRDGTTLIAPTTKYGIQFWSLASGKVRHALLGHTWIVRSLELSPDEHWLASASADNNVKLWNAAAGVEKATLKEGVTSFKT